MSHKVETHCERCRVCGTFSPLLHRVLIEDERSHFWLIHQDSLTTLADWESASPLGYTCPECVAKRSEARE